MGFSLKDYRNQQSKKEADLPSASEPSLQNSKGGFSLSNYRKEKGLSTGYTPTYKKDSEYNFQPTKPIYENEPQNEWERQNPPIPQTEMGPIQFVPGANTSEKSPFSQTPSSKKDPFSKGFVEDNGEALKALQERYNKGYSVSKQREASHSGVAVSSKDDAMKQFGVDTTRQYKDTSGFDDFSKRFSDFVDKYSNGEYKNDAMAKFELAQLTGMWNGYADLMKNDQNAMSVLRSVGNTLDGISKDLYSYGDNEQFLKGQEANKWQSAGDKLSTTAQRAESFDYGYYHRDGSKAPYNPIPEKGTKAYDEWKKSDTKDADLIYQYMISGPYGTDEANDRYGLAVWNDIRLYAPYMNQQEQEIFTNLYRGGDKQKAIEYFKYVVENGSVKENRNAKTTEDIQDYMEEGKAQKFALDAMATFAEPLSAVTYPAQLAEDIITGEVDPYSKLNAVTRFRQTVRQESQKIAQEKYGGVGSFLSGVIGSMADSALNMALFGKAGTYLMGLDAAAQATLDKKKQGGTDEEAMILGGIAGAIEIATERWSVEKFINNISSKTAFAAILKQAASEGAEEGTADIANWIVDGVYHAIDTRTKSEWKKSIEELKDSGMSEKDAIKTAVVDRAKELGLDILGGALSGAIMTGGSVALNGIQNVTNEASANKWLKDNNLTAKDVVESISMMDMESVKKTGEHLSLFDIANNVADAVENGGKVKAYTLTTLLKEATNEYNEAIKAENIADNSDDVANENTDVVNRDSANIGKNQQTAANISIIQQAQNMVGENGAAVMNEMYKEDTDLVQFTSDFVKAYNAGVNGADINTVFDAENMPSLTVGQIQQAYIAGQNDSKGVAINESQNTLQASEERNDGTSAGEQTGVLGTGTSQAGAESISAYEGTSGQSAESIKQPSGPVRYISQETVNKNYGRAVEIAQDYGCVLRVTDDVLYDEEGNQANAYIDIDTNEIVVSRQSKQGVTELTVHEVTHKMIADGKLSVNKAIQDIKSVVGEDGYSAFLELYRSAYAGLGYSEYQIMEEVLADSMAAINIFSDSEYSEITKDMQSVIRSSAYDQKHNGTGADNVSQETEKKYSRNLDREIAQSKYRDRLSEENRNNAKSLTEEQADALDEIASIRHKIHSTSDKMFLPETSEFDENWDYLNPDSDSSIFAIIQNNNLPQIKGLYQLYEDVFWNGPNAENYNDPFYEGEEWYGDYDSAYFWFSDKMEEINNLIETYLSDIDKEQGTHYAPTGIARERFFEPKFSRDASQSTQEVMKANRELETKVRNLEKAVAKWKAETKLTKSAHADEASVRRVAKKLYKEFDFSIDQDEWIKTVQEISDMYYAGVESGNLDYNALRKKTLAAVRNGIETAFNKELFQSDAVEDMYKAAKKYLRKVTIYVPKTNVNDLQDGWNDFRKRYFGVLRLTNDSSASALQIDEVFAELKDQGVFIRGVDEIQNDPDKINLLAETLNQWAPESGNPFVGYGALMSISEAVDMSADMLINDLVDEHIKKAAPTFADREAKRREALEAKWREKYNKAKSKVSVVRDQKNAELQAYKDELKERAKLKRQHIDRKESEERLLKLVRRVRNMKLSSVNRAYIDQYIADIYDVSAVLTGQRKAKIEDIRKAYQERKENNPEFLTSQAMERFLEKNSKTQDIRSMTDEQIIELTEALLEFSYKVQTENKMLAYDDARDVRTLATEVIDDVNATEGTLEKGKLRKMFDKFVVNNALDVSRMIHRITGYNDSDPLYRLFNNTIYKGQQTADKYRVDNEQRFKKWLENKMFVKRFSGKDAARFKVQAYNVQAKKMEEITLTPSMVASLYLHSQNDQNMMHIESSGVKIPNIEQLAKGNYSEAYSTGNRYVLNKQQILGWYNEFLNDEERAFTREAAKYFEQSGEKLADIYEVVNGVPMKQVKNYYPINTDKNFIKKGIDISVDPSVNTMNPGFTKERVDAHNPVNLFTLEDVLMKSITQHANYIGLAVPLNDLNKLLNSSSWLYMSEDSPTAENFAGNAMYADNSVRETIDKKYGADIIGSDTSFINKAILGLARIQQSKDQLWLAKLRSNMASSALELSPSVMLKQMPSGVAAAPVIGYESLVKAMNATKKIDTSFIDKMTAAYSIRAEGFSVVELAELRKYSKHKLPKFLDWITAADLLTTGPLLKRACCVYVQDNFDYAVGSDEYKQTVVDVYERVLSETQPTYDVLFRSNVLRSNSEIVRALNMFKTQPLKNFNILYDAINDRNAKAKIANATGSAEDMKAFKIANKRMVEAVSSQFLSALLIALITFGWDWFRKRDDNYTNDKGEYSVGSAAKGIGLNFFNTVGGMLPYSGVMIEAFETAVDKLTGYDVFGQQMYGASVPELENLNDAVTAVTKMCELTNKIFSGDVEPMSAIKQVYSNMETIFTLMGLPVANARKAVEAVTKRAVSAGGVTGEYIALKITTKDVQSKDVYNLLYKAYKSNNKDYQALYDMVVADGYDEAKIRSAMNTRIKGDSNATKIDEVDYSDRYMSPEQREDYDEYVSDTAGIVSSVPEDKQDKAYKMLYEFATESGAYKSYEDEVEDGADKEHILKYKLYLLAGLKKEAAAQRAGLTYKEKKQLKIVK